MRYANLALLTLNVNGLKTLFCLVLFIDDLKSGQKDKCYTVNKTEAASISQIAYILDNNDLG